jgi:hypothetical protein
MSEEDRIDEIIKGLSADYNRPPETPRDEMWTAIQAARSAPGPKLHVTGGASSAAFGGYKSNHRFGTRYAWIGMAAAAVLLVATGVGIGRYTSKASSPLALPPVPVRVAENGEAGTNSGNNEMPSTSPAPVPSSSGSTTTSAPAQPSPRTRDQILKNPKIVRLGGTVHNEVASTTRSSMPALSNSNEVYTLATAQHLADAETLLTSFQLQSRNQQMDGQFSQWAKGLLSNTRLLLDSPAGDDPRRAKLLQDLELVLAQIVQLSPNAAATDRELIQGSIQRGQVITRLRTAIPAGQPSLER